MYLFWCTDVWIAYLFCFQMRSIQELIRLTRKNLVALNEEFGRHQHPPSMYLQVSCELWVEKMKNDPSPRDLNRLKTQKIIRAVLKKFWWRDICSHNLARNSLYSIIGFIFDVLFDQIWLLPLVYTLEIAFFFYKSFVMGTCISLDMDNITVAWSNSMMDHAVSWKWPHYDLTGTLP